MDIGCFTVAAAVGAAVVVAATGQGRPVWGDHANGHRAPTGPAPVEFAADFTPPADHEYEWPLGGFGGAGRGSALTHLPVVFVHGNQADAQNWYVVRDRFMAEGGYGPQELWALSYGGLGYVGGSAPTVPTSEAEYVAEHPQAAVSGNPQNNDVNVPDLIDFIAAVRDYTGGDRVQIVAHSLGVTIVRKAMVVEPALRTQVTAVVAIAGANHGTSVCRGLDDSYYGCDEIAPDSAWLAELNGVGEAPPPTRWMTVYDGSGVGDIFYDPLVADSPRLAGAEINATYPYTSHNDLRVTPAIVDDYLAFLLAVEADVLNADDDRDGPSPTTAPPPESAPPDDPLPATGGGVAGVAAALLGLGIAGRRQALAAPRSSTRGRAR